MLLLMNIYYLFSYCYVVDAGYKEVSGILAPYRYSSSSNVIEWCFDVLRLDRFADIGSISNYSIRRQILNTNLVCYLTLFGEKLIVTGYSRNF